MLALRVDLLTGRYAATSYNDRTQAEWPPHPARVFSALVAAYHATDPPDPKERRALDWLSRQAPPAVSASEASIRTTVPVFVPVNDVSVVRDFSREVELLGAAEAEIQRLRNRVSRAEGRDRRDAERELATAERSLTKERARLEERIAGSLQPDAATAAAVDTAAAVLPEGRVRQPRTFPSVAPVVPVVHLLWQQASPNQEERTSLDHLVRRVTRIGHSSSLVACRLVDDPPPPDWVPSDRGETVLRVVGEGQLRRLEEEFARHREEQPRTLPNRLQAYTRASEGGRAPTVGVMGEDWIVFRRVEGPGLPTRRVLDLAAALRDALMSCADEPIHEILSGHKPDGNPSETPHVALVALPFVAGTPHADGSLLGAAVVFPRAVTFDDRRHVLRAIGTWERREGTRDGAGGGPARVPLRMGQAGKLILQRLEGAIPLRNLDPNMWCRPSRGWSTVTPIALDRNPGDLRALRTEEAEEALRTAAEIVGRACLRVGLPQPRSVGISPISSFRAAEASVAYGPFPRKKGQFRRVLIHADLTFDQPVRGPVLLGAGRYLGLGLCLPNSKQGD